MTYRHFIFHFQKSLQASAYVLRLAGGRMWYVDLLKMLYIADRECLIEEGDTITGDSVSALERGPVLCTVLNLIKNKDSQSKTWHRFIGAKSDPVTKQLDVFVKKESPGEGKLYKFEKEILDRVYREHQGKDLVAYTHEFPEWKKYEAALNDPNKKNSFPISIEDMLEGIGKPELLTIVKRNIADKKFHLELFGK
jgi:uncharacterized phage-associated protein